MLNSVKCFLCTFLDLVFCSVNMVNYRFRDVTQTQNACPACVNICLNVSTEGRSKEQCFPYSQPVWVPSVSPFSHGFIVLSTLCYLDSYASICLRIFKIFYFYVHRYFSFMYVCMSCACLVPAEAGRGIRFLGLMLLDSCEPPCRWWEWNPCSLEGQSVLLAVISPVPMDFIF